MNTKEISNIPSDTELENLADLYRAMGDNTRMHLLWSLMSGEACVGALASDMDITESAVSHQLRSLRAARRVKSRKAGKHVNISGSVNRYTGAAFFGQLLLYTLIQLPITFKSLIISIWS